MATQYNPDDTPVRCSKCSRHVSELQPFEEPEFKGVKLVKTFRVLVPYNELSEAILRDVKYAEPKTAIPYSDTAYKGLWRASNFIELEQKYGRALLHQAYVYDLMADSIVTYHECRDCFAKSSKQFSK